MSIAIFVYFAYNFTELTLIYGQNIVSDRDGTTFNLNYCNHNTPSCHVLITLPGVEMNERIFWKDKEERLSNFCTITLRQIHQESMSADILIKCNAT